MSAPPTRRQLSLFAGETPAPKSKGPRWWTLKGGETARVCPACGCGKVTPCTIAPGVQCAPAGAGGSRVCSGCAALDH